MQKLKKRILFIGLVWPEPTSSAAGTRILQLLKLLSAAGADIYFASAANKSTYSFPLHTLGIKELFIELNSATIDTDLKEINPEIVIFDRYITEEQYGWRVREICENALTVLDTEDLHFLRFARQKSVKSNIPINYKNEIALREIASILRCDLSLIISEYELNLLKNEFHISEDLLHYLPFLEEVDNLPTALKFEARNHCMFIGNFLHEPNWHTVQTLKTKIWPTLRKLIPNAELHIYGAYSTEKVLQLHKPTDQFFIKGRAEDSVATLGKYKLLLAPIQYGAGAKGKFIDAMLAGTPSITTSIGAEGMYSEEWGGKITDDLSHFVTLAAHLYNHQQDWEVAQHSGYKILQEKYKSTYFIPLFLEILNARLCNIKEYRDKNFLGKVLQHHNQNSLKYMSLWIAEKNKK